jgi:hypothetical protein
MNPRELVDHIRSGPAELMLNKLPPFHHQTNSNPCDFTEFLQALQSSETIRYVYCPSQLRLGIAEDEWVLLVETLGSIEGLQTLKFKCESGSRDFRRFQAIAEAVNSARSLCKLTIDRQGETLPTDPSGLIALAGALREHTTLRTFNWHDFGSRHEAAPRDFSLDPVLRALPACPHLRRVFIKTERASADALEDLLQLTNTSLDLTLALTPDHWLAVADGIRQGRCNLLSLTLIMLQGTSPNATEAEAVKEVASAIQTDRHLTFLYLQLENGFTDEAGVALAAALTVNKTLFKLALSSTKSVRIGIMPNTAALGAPAYEAFSAMLRVNTSLRLILPPFETDGTNDRLCESREQLRIEQRLNQVGRLFNSSDKSAAQRLNQTPRQREQWIGALHELSSGNVDDSPNFQVSCLYSVLRSDPTTVYMS